MNSKEMSNKVKLEGEIIGDGEPDKLVNEFINFCHADYLMQ